MTEITQNPQSSSVPSLDAKDITQLIETHDIAGALGKLHTAVQALDDKQYHELLWQVIRQNESDWKQQNDLPVVHLTNINGIDGLQIDDGKRSITFCEDHNADASDAKKEQEGKHAPKESAAAKEGLFYFYNEVDHDSVLNLTQQMEKWIADPKNKDLPLRIVMNSPGGSVFDGFSLMDEIARVRQCGHRVKIEDYGMAASAAGWIMQAADTRAIGANSWMLIHEPSGNAAGKLSIMGQEVKLSKELEDQFIGLLAARSHLTADNIRKHIENGTDWWIPAKTAKALGLVDVIEPVPPFQPGR